MRARALAAIACYAAAVPFTVAISGCGSTAPASVTSASTAQQPAPQGAFATQPPQDASPTARTTPTTAARMRTTQAGSTLPGGVVLPNRRLTPGAVSAAVTQANIKQTICRTGYTKTVRPSSTYTTSLKRSQLAAGYTFHGDLSTADYEEDHLISLELGGSPTSVKNLWPEPYRAAEGARVKDRVENELHDRVCAGQMSLRAAQQAIASNWWTAYQRYGGSGAADVWVGSYDSGAGSSSSTSTATVAAAPAGATARCVDGTYSYSAHRRGTCSRHGGVATWINPPAA